MHKIRFHFKHSINQSVLEQCWIRWWRMFRWIFCPQTFLKQFLPWILKFLKICFKTSSIVCEMISASKNSFCCIRVTIFARHFFFENVERWWYHLMAFQYTPIPYGFDARFENFLSFQIIAKIGLQVRRLFLHNEYR